MTLMMAAFLHEPVPGNGIAHYHWLITLESQNVRLWKGSGEKQVNECTETFPISSENCSMWPLMRQCSYLWTDWFLSFSFTTIQTRRNTNPKDAGYF